MMRFDIALLVSGELFVGSVACAAPPSFENFDRGAPVTRSVLRGMV